MILEQTTAVLLLIAVPILTGMLLQWIIFRIRRSYPWKKRPVHPDREG